MENKCPTCESYHIIARDYNHIGPRHRNSTYIKVITDMLTRMPTNPNFSIFVRDIAYVPPKVPKKITAHIEKLNKHLTAFRQHCPEEAGLVSNLPYFQNSSFSRFHIVIDKREGEILYQIKPLDFDDIRSVLHGLDPASSNKGINNLIKLMEAGNNGIFVFPEIFNFLRRYQCRGGM